jgi:four helix bundle protein
MKEENVIVNKSTELALEIIELYKILKSSNEFVLSKQLLRSGTSIGANVHEAIAAQSKKDFLSKMSIASKEARETKYWLMLLQKSQLIKLDYSECLEKTEEVIKILTSIVKSTGKSLNS